MVRFAFAHTRQSKVESFKPFKSYIYFQRTYYLQYGRKRRSILIFSYFLNSLKGNSYMEPSAGRSHFRLVGILVCTVHNQFNLIVHYFNTSQMSQPLMISKFLARQKSQSRWTGRTHQLMWITSGSCTLTRQDRRRS